jgi:hypothetical protein
VPHLAAGSVYSHEAIESVVDMAQSASPLELGSEFHDFLYAPVGEDRNGMMLSVLSALARLDVDPWQEAADLTRLPGEAAISRLASLIATLPEGPSGHRDSGTIAARLIALLPRRVSSKIGSDVKSPVVGTPTSTWVIMFVLFLIVSLAVQWMVGSLQPPGQIDDGRTPAASTSLPPHLRSPPRALSG